MVAFRLPGLHIHQVVRFWCSCLVLYKSNLLFEFGSFKGIGYLDDVWWTSSSDFRECCQILFGKSILRINFESSFQGPLCLVVAFLHHETYAEISPRLEEAITHCNGVLESLACLFPLVGYHKGETTLKMLLLLDELIQGEI